MHIEYEIINGQSIFCYLVQANFKGIIWVGQMGLPHSSLRLEILPTCK